MRKHRAYLEGTDDAAAGDIRGLLPGDVLASVKDLPRRRLQELGEQIKERRLAGAVRTDQRVNFSASHLERHAVDRHEPLERLEQRPRFQDDISGRNTLHSCSCSFSSSASVTFRCGAPSFLKSSGCSRYRASRL